MDGINNRICPRCGHRIPPWQPIHLPCLAHRLRFVLAGLLLIFCVLFFSRLNFEVKSSPSITTQVQTEDNTENTQTPVKSTKTSTVISTRNNPTLPTKTKTTNNQPTPILPTKTRVADIKPTPTFEWSKCNATYSTRLEIGDSVEIGEFSSPFGYNVLSGPYKDKDKVGTISPGDQAKVIAGPSCSNKWIWWVIKLDKNDVSGWIPEGDANSFWLLTAYSSSVGEYAKISKEVAEVNLRRSPGYINKNDKDDVIVKIPSGATVTLVDGPRKADSLDWWYVEWNGHKGWIAEKTGSGRTIMIFNP